MSEPMTLSPEAIALLCKVLAPMAKATRNDLPTGRHDIDEVFALHVRGSLNVGDDYEAKIVAKAKPWALYAALLREANKRLAAAGAVGIDLSRVVAAAEVADPGAIKLARAQADRLVASTKAPTNTLCMGKVTAKAALVPTAQA
jgi:hypothetical protein